MRRVVWVHIRHKKLFALSGLAVCGYTLGGKKSNGAAHDFFPRGVQLRGDPVKFREFGFVEVWGAKNLQGHGLLSFFLVECVDKVPHGGTDEVAFVRLLYGFHSLQHGGVFVVREPDVFPFSNVSVFFFGHSFRPFVCS